MNFWTIKWCWYCCYANGVAYVALPFYPRFDSCSSEQSLSASDLQLTSVSSFIPLLLALFPTACKMQRFIDDDS